MEERLAVDLYPWFRKDLRLTARLFVLAGNHLGKSEFSIGDKRVLIWERLIQISTPSRQKDLGDGDFHRAPWLAYFTLSERFEILRKAVQSGLSRLSEITSLEQIDEFARTLSDQELLENYLRSLWEAPFKTAVSLFRASGHELLNELPLEPILLWKAREGIRAQAPRVLDGCFLLRGREITPRRTTKDSEVKLFLLTIRWSGGYAICLKPAKPEGVFTLPKDDDLFAEIVERSKQQILKAKGTIEMFLEELRAGLVKCF